ncbi:hypothetical protein [Kitasatospora paranensis]|uniref:DUF35 domain-containing protein n=1 Tax=Kitasatospora paranensis TaxID=258053 RepID=A0ABW2G6Z4_9ACTN
MNHGFDTRTSPVPTAAAPEPEAVLLLGRCRWCRAVTQSYRLLCPACGAEGMDEVASRGLGIVRCVGALARTADLVHRVRQSCTITLDEGLRIPAVVTAERYDRIPIGARVRLTALAPGSGTAEFRLV